MSDSTVPMSALPQLSLPEEFLLLSHHRYGDAHDSYQVAIGCAAAELGELALRRRLRVTPQKKSELLGFKVDFLSGEIHLLDFAPIDLAWADDLLAELVRLAASQRAPTASQRGPISLRQWLRIRGDEALFPHREALTERSVLFHSPGRLPGQEERHYPDVAVRNVLISRLQAVTNERVPMDEHMLLLMGLVESAGLSKDLGLTLSMRQRLDHARGIGAVAALSEDRSTSTALSNSIPSRKQGGAGGNGGGDGRSLVVPVQSRSSPSRAKARRAIATVLLPWLTAKFLFKPRVGPLRKDRMLDRLGFWRSVAGIAVIAAATYRYQNVSHLPIIPKAMDSGRLLPILLNPWFWGFWYCTIYWAARTGFWVGEIHPLLAPLYNVSRAADQRPGDHRRQHHERALPALANTEPLWNGLVPDTVRLRIPAPPVNRLPVP